MDKKNDTTDKKGIKSQYYSLNKDSIVTLLAEEVDEAVELMNLDNDSFRKLEEYMIRNGLMLERTRIKDETKAEKMRELRSAVYHDVEIMLKEYRSFRSIRDEYLQEIKERIQFESSIRIPQKRRSTQGLFSELPFDKLSEELQIMDAVEDRQFKKIYLPILETGRRIDYALYAIDQGLSTMRDRKMCKLLRYVYVTGKKKPSVRDTLDEFEISKGTYYHMMPIAISKLSLQIFGNASPHGRQSKAELRGIFATLCSESDEELSMDEMDEVLEDKS